MRITKLYSSSYHLTPLCWPTLSKLSAIFCPKFWMSYPSQRRPQYLSPSNPPRVRGNVRDAIRDDGVAAVGTGMCRLRRPGRRWLWTEGTGEASGLAGEKTFGDFGSFQSHSPQPEGRAKSCRWPSPRVLHGASRAANSQAHHIPMTRTSDYASLIEPTVLTKKEPSAPFAIDGGCAAPYSASRRA